MRLLEGRYWKERAQVGFELRGRDDLNIIIVVIIWMTILVLILSFDGLFSVKSARMGLGVAFGTEVGCRFDQFNPVITAKRRLYTD